MKLHVKHLKSNKKVNFLSFNYFAYSIFEEEKKKSRGRKKKKEKNGEKFPGFEDTCFSHQHPMPSPFLCTDQPLWGRAGAPGTYRGEDGSADNWGALAALKHL